ncbi:MAG: carbohydrate porin [Sphingomonas sp.]
MSNVAGGVAQSAKALSKFAIAAAYDGSRDDHPGWNALASVQFTHGGRLSGNAIGDAQGADNIDTAGALRLYELWVSRDYDGAKGWKAGLVDLNVDFDTQEVAALFLNSSDGIGPELGHSGINGPSIYPTTALGVTGYLKTGPGLTLRAGLFDGTAGSPYHPRDFAVRLSGKDGVLVIAQAEQRFNAGVRLNAGAWAYSAFFDALNRFDDAGNPQRYQRSRGVYALVEAPLIKAGADGERGLSGWIRVGLGDPVVQQISGYVGGGVVYTGPFAARAQDQVGLGINHAIVTLAADPMSAPQGQRAETAFELTYRYNATDWLAVQPDTQVILHPSGSLPTALVVGLRLSVTLTKNLTEKIKAAVK